MKDIWYDQTIINTVKSGIIVVVILALLLAFYILINKMIKAQKKIKESEEQYRRLFTTMQQGIAIHEVILNKEGKPVDYRLIDANDNYFEMQGLIREEKIGKTMLEIYPDDFEAEWIEDFCNVAITGEPIKFDQQLSTFTYEKWFEVILYSPKKYQFAAILTEITERVHLEEALANEKNLMETTIASVGDGVISTDFEGNIILLNRTAQYLTGWEQKDAKGKPIDEIFNIVDEFTRERNDSLVKEALDSGKDIKFSDSSILISKNGKEQPIEGLATPIIRDNGEIVGMVLVFRDYAEKKQKQAEIKYLSEHDQLTGLYNRRFYDKAIKDLNDEKYVPLTLVMADINGLKLANDAFGHKVGDLLIEKVASIIKKVCRQEDIAARIGGDEFVILLPETDAKNAEIVINRINAAIADEKLENCIISLSLGYAVKEDNTLGLDDVYKQAEDEMYKQKLTASASMKSKTIDLIMKTLHEKFNREMLHSKRVSEFCGKLAERMDFNEDEVNEIKTAGLMHDIGKIGIEEKIINKPNRLDSDEWNEMERHSEIGYRILNCVDEYEKISNYVLEHHEKYNGKGYPKGLKGEDILLQARIIAVADAYDAMMRKPSLGSSMSEDDAVKELKRCAGSQLDPNITKIFVEKVLGKKWDVEIKQDGSEKQEAKVVKQ